MFNSSNLISRCVKHVYKSNARPISFRSFGKLLSIYFGRQSKGSKPPYNHICQIGDPILRKKAELIPKDVIQTLEFQKKLDHLHKVMKKYNTVGLSAPQVGFPLQFFAIEITEKHVQNIAPELLKVLQMQVQPLTYFINPTLEIIDSGEYIMYEMCESINCYRAEVPRAKEVQIRALNRFGEPFCWKSSGWTARILQHEMDHLKGILYIDRMYPLTFEYAFWDNLNENNGKVVLD